MKVKVKSLSRVRLLATPWTAAYQAPLPTGFSRQEYLEVTKKSQSIMNNAITEIKSTLAGTNSRITEAEDRVSGVEDRMEINEVERKKRENNEKK